MPHPIMFRDDDFGLPQLRAIALGFPESFEKISWGRPAFCAPKMFAMYGGNAKAAGSLTPYPHSLLVKVDESDRRALAQDRRFFVPAYLGPSGWLGLDLTARRINHDVDPDVDWEEVRELVDASYRLIAPKKLVRQLDERSGR